MGRLAPLFGSRALRLFVQTAGTRVLGMASSSLLVVLLARTLDPAQYGVYALFTTTYIFGTLLAGLNLSANLVRRVPGKSDAEAASLLATFVLTEMGIGALVVVAFVASGLDRRLARAMEIGDYLRELRMVGAVIALDLGSTGCLNFLLARKRFAVANTLTLLRSSLLGPLLALAWLAGVRVTVSAIAGVWLAATLVALGFGMAASGLWRTVGRVFDRGALKGAALFGLQIASQSFAFYFLKLSDRYFLAHYASVRDVGIYSFAYTLSNIAYSLSALVLVGLLQPHIVEAHNQGDLARRDALLGQMTRACLAAVMVAVVATALLARHLILFARPSYLESARVLPWLLLTLFPVVAAYPASTLLMLEGKMWVSMMADVLSIAVALPLQLVLVRRMSYWGALVASMAGFAVLAGVQHAAARSWRFLDPRAFIHLGSDLASLASERPPVRAAAPDAVTPPPPRAPDAAG